MRQICIPRPGLSTAGAEDRSAPGTDAAGRCWGCIVLPPGRGRGEDEEGTRLLPVRHQAPDGSWPAGSVSAQVPEKSWPGWRHCQARHLITRPVHPANDRRSPGGGADTGCDGNKPGPRVYKPPGPAPAGRVAPCRDDGDKLRLSNKRNSFAITGLLGMLSLL